MVKGTISVQRGGRSAYENIHHLGRAVPAAPGRRGSASRFVRLPVPPASPRRFSSRRPCTLARQPNSSAGPQRRALLVNAGSTASVHDHINHRRRAMLNALGIVPVRVSGWSPCDQHRQTQPGKSVFFRSPTTRISGRVFRSVVVPNRQPPPAAAIRIRRNNTASVEVADVRKLDLPADGRKGAPAGSQPENSVPRRVR